MADDPTPPAPAPAPPAPAPAPAPEPAPAPPAPAPAPPDDDSGVWDHQRGMATIRKLRSDIAMLRADGDVSHGVLDRARRADELEQELKALKDAQLTEEQRIAQERDELLEQKTGWDREKRDTALRLAVHDLRDELGVADTDLAIAALDVSQVEYGPDGKPTNVEGLLTALLERKPLLKVEPGKKKAPSADGGKGSQAGPPPDLTAEELEFAKEQGISAERYAAMKNVGNVDEFIELRKKETQPGS